jgi:hypothetical protein
MQGVKSKHSIKLGGITLMLIPHSQKKILKLRINGQWFIFIAILLILLCGLSVAAIYWNQQTAREKFKNESEMNVWDTKKWIVSHSESQIFNQIKSFKNYGNGFYYQIWDKSIYTNTTEDSMIQLDSEVFQELMLPLDRVLQFIIEREENFLNLPLGWPVTQGSITSDFGDRVSPFGFTTDFHSGTDFANVVGTPIFATASGEVTYAGNSNTGYGYYVKILHNHGFLTLYAHASKILVQEKQQVKRGEMIALMGRSGSVTGPHVHYEIRQFSLDEAGYPFELFLNPLPFVKEKW